MHNMPQSPHQLVGHRPWHNPSRRALCSLPAEGYALFDVLINELIQVVIPQLLQLLILAVRPDDDLLGPKFPTPVAEAVDVEGPLEGMPNFITCCVYDTSTVSELIRRQTISTMNGAVFEESKTVGHGLPQRRLQSVWLIIVGKREPFAGTPLPFSEIAESDATDGCHLELVPVPVIPE